LKSVRRPGTFPFIRGFIISQAALTVAIAALYVLPGLAQAGQMSVYSCHAPSGRSVGTAGWTVVANGAPTQLRAANDCGSGPRGSLIARIGGTGAEHGNEHLTWTFQAAPQTTISSFSASICARAQTWDALSSVNWLPNGLVFVNTFDQPKQLGCVGLPPWSANQANTVQRDRLATPRVEFQASCFMGGCPELQGVVSDIEVSSFRADIRDDVAPTVSSVSGPLATSVTHTGVDALDFAASDVGVGVFRGVVEMRINGSDAWREMTASILDPGGSCTPLHETRNLYEFDSPQPCPLNLAQGSVSLDSALVPEGTHEVRAYVEDAAGNTRATAVVASAPQPAPSNGRGASRSARLRITAPGRPLLPSAGEFRLAGQLLDRDENPIAGATVLVQSRAFLPKAALGQGPWSTVGTITTDDKGLFRGRIPGGSSRSLLVTYAAEPSDATPAASVQTDLVVPAQVTVKARRLRVRNGRSAVLTGRVAGPIPHGGVLVAMEVREPGRWIPVATTRRWVRTRSSGSFSLSYRFRSTFQPATYRFRVVADEDSAFPYGRGASRSVKIHVRP
jgi:hypothetical protein